MRFLPFLLLALLIALLVWGLPKAVPAASRSLSTPSRARSPSDYWRAEHKLVAALHAQGRLGAMVRRLRAENRRLRLVHARTLRSPASAGPVARTIQQAVTGLLCIHGGEGSWADPAATYYGGLQMDAGFQQTWAPALLRTLGTADHWTPVQQVLAGALAWTVRGYEPWPNTSRACGLR